MPNTRKKSEANTRLDEPIEIPERVRGTPDEDRLRHVNRNLRIKEEYHNLLEQHPWEEAEKKVADRYHVSRSTVRKVLSADR